jgi:hypothetical protein
MRTTRGRRWVPALRGLASASLGGTQAERPARMRTSSGVSELGDGDTRDSRSIAGLHPRPRRSPCLLGGRRVEAS